MQLPVPHDERDQRRRARQQQDRPAGIHDRAARRAELSRGAALRRRGVPHAEEADRRARHAHHGRRRGRLRARTCRRTRRRCSCWWRRSTRPATRRAPTSRSRCDCAASEFYKDGKYVLESENRALTSEQFADMLADLVRQVSDHQHRGRHVGARLGRLEVPDRAPRQERAARRRRHLRHQHQDPEAGHRQGHRQFDPDQDQPDRHADRRRSRRSRWPRAPATRR